MKAPLERQAVKIESQCSEFYVCGVLELVPPRILLKSAPFWHCREVKRLLSRVVFSQSVFFLEPRARYAAETGTIGEGVPWGVRGGAPPGPGREPAPGQ
jgi:hypothetical protein